MKTDLKPTDLMIGDSVRKLELGGHTIHVKVTGILDDQVDYVRRDGVRGTIGIKGIKPIPLTPKILEKNGFENVGDYTWQLTDGPYWFWIDFFNYRYGCEYDTSSYEIESSESRLYLYGIPDVHELQHALKICGIDKDIIL